jgi:hypothetical protein
VTALARPGPVQWLPVGRPEYLLQQAVLSDDEFAELDANTG